MTNEQLYERIELLEDKIEDLEEELNDAQSELDEYKGMEEEFDAMVDPIKNSHNFIELLKRDSLYTDELDKFINDYYMKFHND